MGEVNLVMRILPESPDVDLDGLRDAVEGALPENARLASHDVAPFAFGLKALVCNIVVPDESGLADRVEETLRALDDVQGVELVDMGRLM